MRTEVEATLVKQLSKGEKITITSGRHQYLAFFIFLLSIGIFGLGIYYSDLVSSFLGVLSPIGYYSVLAIFSLILCLVSFKLADVGVRKDIIFINYFFLPCRVLAINEISKIRSFSIFGVFITTIKYEYGDSKKHALFFRNRRAHPKKVVDDLKSKTNEKSANL